jgi:nitrile hydratase beta subunit
VNGIHDLGGMHGFGPVDRDPNEPPFHGRWEAAVVAIMRATRGARLYNIDEFRHGIERMPAARYLASTYFERWLDGILRILDEKGVVTAAEMDARTGAVAGSRAPAAPPAVDHTAAQHSDSPFRTATVAPRFTLGAAVVGRNVHPPGHTRLPRYARGKRGVIVAQRGCHVFPDTHAHGLGEQPQHVYAVRFDARELWGEAAEPRQFVYLDLWESYLDPA